MCFPVFRNPEWTGRETQRDNEYMSAVESGDTETAQRLVDEEAKAKGYDSPMLYHGTDSFGFTEFDLNKMDDNRSIFLTSSKDIASTYSGIEGERKISEASKIDVDKLSAEEIAKTLNEVNLENYNYSYYDKSKVEQLKSDDNNKRCLSTKKIRKQQPFL